MTRSGRAAMYLGALLIATIQAVGQTSPVANAGPDQTASVAERVILDGSASTVPNGSPIFLWTFVVRPDGSGAALSSRSAARPSFVVDVPGTYVLSLVVSDGQTTSAPDLIVVSAFNRPPVADAGVDLLLGVGETAVLDGSQSFDPDFDRLTYEWSFLLKPDSSRAVLSAATSPTPQFTVDAPGVFWVQLTVNDGRVASRPAVVVVRTQNSAPSANAGSDQSARVGDQVRLDASLSSDLDGDAVKYSWTFSSRPFGSVAAFDNPSAVFPTFVPDLPGAYRARLVVSDGQAASADTVVISTNNSVPVANAGRDLHVHAGEFVRLDGSLSADADNQLLEFAWTLVSRPAASNSSLFEPTAVRPAFFVDVPGTYIARLMVFDGFAWSAADEVRISTDNVPPVANAGRDQVVRLGSVARVSGAASTDADGDELGFRWALISQPAGSTAILFNVQAVRPTIVPDVAGSYVLQLMVTDGRAISEPDTVILTTDAIAPTAVAGPDQRVPVGFSAVLDGTGSFDAAGMPLTYEWTIQVRPPGSSAQLVRDAAVTVLIADTPGVYVANLIVRNATLTSALDTVVVTTETENAVPVADAGADQDVRIGTGVMLDGRASTDAEHAQLVYAWSLIYRPFSSRAVLSDSTTATPSFVADQPGPYLAQLVVFDGAAYSAPSTVLVVAANRVNHAPVANAGADQHVAPGTIVRLDASGSSDPDGDALKYAWTLTPPPGAFAPLDDPTSNTPTFFAGTRGRYDAQVAVTDGALTSIDSLVIVANNAPTADAGPDQAVVVDDPVHLDARASSDADFDSLTYLWTLHTPAGSSARLDNPASATPAFVPDVAGSYSADLVVNDGLDNSAADSIVVVATSRPTPFVGCGTTVRGAIVDPLRKDRYTFTAAAGEAVIVAVVGVSGSIRPRADIFDQDGVFVLGGLAVNGSSLSTVIPRTGTYTITVADDDLRDSGEYNLSLQFSTGRCARLIACGQTLVGELPGADNPTGDARAQEDAYQFSATAGEAVIFAVVHSSGLLRPRGDLYDPLGRFVPGGLAVDGSSLSTRLAATGTYTIVVRDDDLKDAGTYNINLQFTTGRCAQAIACGQTLAGQMPDTQIAPNSPQARQDAFKFDANAGEAVVFSAVSTSAPLRPRADLYDPTGRFVPGGLAVDGSSLPTPLAATGTYTLVVRDDDLKDSGAYNINLQFTTGRCATSLACGVPATATIPGARNATGAAAAEQHAYSFAASAGDVVSFSTRQTVGPLIPRGDLYSPEGRFLPGGLAVNGASLPVTAAATGVYTIVIRDNDLRDGGTYTVSYSPAAGCPNRAPTANAGADQTVDVGSIVQLDASASSDPDGQPLSYAWTFVSTPAGSAAAISPAEGITPTFTPDKIGVYDVQLVVSDGRAQHTDTVRIVTCSIAPAGLISWWRADGVAIDNSNRHHGTLEGGAAFGQGLRKSAFVFDGIDGRVRIDGGESLSGSPSGFAVSFWTFFDESQLTGNDQFFGVRGLVGQYDQTTPDLGSWFFTLHDGLLSFSLFDRGNSVSVDAASLTNRFVHVAGVFDGTQMQLFIDGQMRASAVNAMPVLRIADPVMIGAIAPQSFAAPFAGRIDEIAFFNAPLTADDIGRLFQLGVDGGCVVPSNRPPTADAGTDQLVDVGATVALDGSRSSDPDGDALTYSWTLTAKPSASSATLTGDTTSTPTFAADAPGAYVVQLVVNDGRVDSAPAVVHVTTRNRPPTANPGPNQSVTVGTPVTLDGSASSDPDGDALTYLWAFTARPAGSSAVLSNATTPTPTFVADVPGSYDVTLTVDDGRGGTSSASVRVSATPPSVCTVTANAGPDQTVALDSTVQLAGSGFSSCDRPLSFSWRFVATPSASAASLANAATARPTFVADATGTYQLELTVSDGESAATARTTITAYLACGQTVKRTIAAAGQRDTFQFAASQGEAVMFASVGTSGTLLARSELLSPTGVQIAVSNSSGFLTSPALPQTGTYTIVVHDLTLTAVGTYNLSLQFTTGRCAQSIACGQTLNAAVPSAQNTTGSPNAQIDAFRFTANAGEAVMFTADGTAGTIAPTLELFSPSGIRVAVIPAGVRSSTPLAQTGVYTLVVHDLVGNKGGAYNVNLQFTTGRCAASIACGQTLAGAFPGGANATGFPHTQQDAYAFTAAANEAVLFAVAPTSGTPLVQAQLFGPTGASLSFANTNASSGSVTLAQPGRYTILVRTLSGSGAYNLNLQFTTGRCAQTIACGQTLNAAVPNGANLTGSAAAERDAFKFDATAGEAVAYAVAATAGGFQAFGDLYSPSGRFLLSTPAGPTSTLTETGTYTLLVRNLSAGSYNVNLQFTSGRCAAALCNQTLTAAIPGGVNLTGFPQAQQESYSFTGGVGDTVTFGAVAKLALPQLLARAHLFGPGGQSLLIATTNGASSTVLRSPGTYTVLVHDVGFTLPGEYSVSMHTTGVCTAPTALATTGIAESTRWLPIR